jgi:uracil-DNA glycosylase family 4
MAYETKLIPVEECRRCPRLVAWREAVANDKVKRFALDTYWGKPVPSFGDVNARVLVVGLAPAAHGANRTGRMFTGDRSGEWLYRALHKAGFASQPESISRDDGLTLTNCLISAVVRCVPPANKPTPDEVANCRPYLIHDIRSLSELTVIIGLGKIAFDAAWDVALPVFNPEPVPKLKRPVFGHGAAVQIPNGPWLLGSYHPSQQNTFTGKLTEPMFDAVFAEANRLLALRQSAG